MRRYPRWAWLGALPVLLGCPDGPRVPDTIVVDTPEVAPPAAGQELGRTAPLEPVSDADLTGELTVTPVGTATEVLVRITGATPGAAHQGHVHRGVCDAIGAVVAPLEPITVEPDGEGLMVTLVEIPWETLTDGAHVVVYHAADRTPGDPELCGAVPAAQA